MIPLNSALWFVAGVGMLCAMILLAGTVWGIATVVHPGDAHAGSVEEDRSDSR